MPGKKQSNKKEKKLIKGCIYGEETAVREFHNLFKKTIFNIAMWFTEDLTEAEDVTQEIVMKIFREIRKREIKIDLKAWVVKVARNYCIDVYRKSRPKKASKPVNHISDNSIASPLQDVTSSLSLDTMYIRTIPSTLRKSIDFSLKLIEIFYKLIEEIKSDPANYERIFKIHKILLDTRKKVNQVIGYVSKKKIATYNRLRWTLPEHLSDSEKKELEKLKKQAFLIATHEDLNEFVNRINGGLDSKDLQDFLYIATNTPSHAEYFHAEYYLFVIFDLALKLKTMKIKPPRLMFSVWVKGLRKGKYTHRKRIKLVFYYFKRRTKGTQQEFLFDSIDDNLSNFESIRKSYYKRSPKERIYKELVNTIYKHSFVYDRKVSNF